VAVALSVVLVAYDMARELPRTLRSLRAEHQTSIDGSEYELIVIDNGSPRPLEEALPAAGRTTVRSRRLTAASSSPAPAANVGLEMASGDLVGLMIDGARIASPGLFASALSAARLAERPVIATLGWHLGSGSHMEAETTGYDTEAEDRLLAESGWEEDGYRLFAFSSFAASSRRGWFGPLSESNTLFMPRSMWEELDGVDERFELPGGGLANHDLFHRACSLSDAQLIVLLGEGTFHQTHGGAATSGRITWAQAREEYEAVHGRPFAPPANEPLYVGHVPKAALAHLEYSVRWALTERQEGASGSSRAGAMT
jgi:hypothetical protein